jgi:hypothetical protein
MLQLHCNGFNGYLTGARFSSTCTPDTTIVNIGHTSVVDMMMPAGFSAPTTTVVSIGAYFGACAIMCILTLQLSGMMVPVSAAHIVTAVSI